MNGTAAVSAGVPLPLTLDPSVGTEGLSGAAVIDASALVTAVGTDLAASELAGGGAVEEVMGTTETGGAELAPGIGGTSMAMPTEEQRVWAKMRASGGC